MPKTATFRGDSANLSIFSRIVRISQAIGMRSRMDRGGKSLVMIVTANGVGTSPSAQFVPMNASLNE